MRTMIILSAVLLFSSPVYAAPNQQSFDERLYDAKVAAVRAEIDAMKEAVKVKTDEMDRRLLELNELRKEVVKDREQYVRKDIYDSKVKEYDEAVRRLANIESRIVAYASAIVVVFALLNIGIHLWGLRSKAREHNTLRRDPAG